MIIVHTWMDGLNLRKAYGKIDKWSQTCLSSTAMQIYFPNNNNRNNLAVWTWIRNCISMQISFRGRRVFRSHVFERSNDVPLLSSMTILFGMYGVKVAQPLLKSVFTRVYWIRLSPCKSYIVHGARMTSSPGTCKEVKSTWEESISSGVYVLS